MKINVGKSDICYSCKYGKQVTCEANHMDIEFNRNTKCIERCKLYEQKEEKPKRSRFVKPTVEEINAYCDEKGYTNVDAVAFINYFESVGWKVGRNLKPMVSWKQAVANWNTRQQEFDRQRNDRNNANRLRSKPTYNLSAYNDFAVNNTEI